MSRVARLGWLCFCALLGLGCVVWMLRALPVVVGNDWAANGMTSFALVFLWLPACIVLLGLVAVIGTLFLYFGHHDAAGPGRPRRRLVTPNLALEPSNPDPTLPFPGDGDSRPGPGAAPDAAS